MVTRNRIAQIYNNKIHWIFETNQTLEVVKARFAPNMVFVDITGLDYAENWDWDSETNTATAPVLVETPIEVNPDEKVAALDTEFEPQFAELALAYATALMACDTETTASIQEDYAALKVDYQTALEAIING